MGGKSSKKASSSGRSNGSSYGRYAHAFPPPDERHRPNPPYPPYSNPPSQNYPSYPQPRGYAPNQTSGGRQQKVQSTYARIEDNFKSLDQVTMALVEAGLESSNLIVGIDFTKSNEWTGINSFNRQSLHHIGGIKNPYEQALSIIGKTLSPFDEDNLIPCFGFGDASTHDDNVFAFFPDERPCNGFEEALSRYCEIVPRLKLSGPTSFAPIIEMAVTIVERSRGQYHVLLIIADGQVTRSVDTDSHQLSVQEQKTVDAIVQASRYPLSIVLVGVGDGPWDMMKEFDDNIPSRAFDNFQFVNFTEIMSMNAPESKKEAAFALAALMEIPSQYKATLELGTLGRQAGECPNRVPLPTPDINYSLSSSVKPPSHPGYHTAQSTYRPASSSSDSQVCSVCCSSTKNMAFSCGHQTCSNCGPALEECPICWTPIVTRIRLY